MSADARLEKLYRNGVEYSLQSHVQFIKDAEAAGHKVELQHNYLYSGPCVRTDQPSVFQKVTTVRCKVDYKGRAVFVRPFDSDDIVASIAANNSGSLMMVR